MTLRGSRKQIQEKDKCRHMISREYTYGESVLGRVHAFACVSKVYYEFKLGMEVMA